MSETPHNLISPEYRLDCSKEDIQFLYSKLPSRENCIIKDYEDTKDDFFIYYKGLDGIEFEIVWDVQSKCFYAYPPELVKKLILCLKDENPIESQNPKIKDAIKHTTAWVRKKIADLHSENGQIPEIIKIDTEAGLSLLIIREQTANAIESASNKNHNKVEKLESDIIERLKFDFNPKIGVAAIKLACAFDSKTNVAQDIGIPYHNIIRYTNQTVRRFHEESSLKIQTWLFRNMHKLSIFLQHTRRADKALNSEESTILDEFLFEHKDDLPVSKQETNELNVNFTTTLAIQALQIASHFKTANELAKEIGITRPTLGKYLYGAAVTTREETKFKFKNWLIRHGTQLVGFINPVEHAALYKFITANCL